jgi:beta-lactam-binding protein with PASTA domain
VVLAGLVGLYFLINSVLMPIYTRQNVEVTVPEVRELTFEEASRLVEGRRLQAERRDQPFNPAFPRDVVLDQNPSANASVKPGRRVYLYVNSGTERTVSMPELRTLTEGVARAELSDLGLTDIEVRTDESPSPFAGTVTRQAPDAGESIRTSESVTLWLSPGPGDALVTVPDVRGMSYDAAAEAIVGAGLWVDPTRSVSGTITRQEPSAGGDARIGSEVRLSSVPIEEEVDEYPEGLMDEYEDTIPEESDPAPADPTDEPERDAGRIDW